MPKYFNFKICGYYLYFTSHCIVECMHAYYAPHVKIWAHLELDRNQSHRNFIRFDLDEKNI